MGNIGAIGSRRGGERSEGPTSMIDRMSPMQKSSSPNPSTFPKGTALSTSGFQLGTHTFLAYPPTPPSYSSGETGLAECSSNGSVSSNTSVSSRGSVQSGGGGTRDHTSISTARLLCSMQGPPGTSLATGISSSSSVPSERPPSGKSLQSSSSDFEDGLGGIGIASREGRSRGGSGRGLESSALDDFPRTTTSIINEGSGSSSSQPMMGGEGSVREEGEKGSREGLRVTLLDCTPTGTPESSSYRPPTPHPYHREIPAPSITSNTIPTTAVPTIKAVVTQSALKAPYSAALSQAFVTSSNDTAFNTRLNATTSTVVGRSELSRIEVTAATNAASKNTDTLAATTTSTSAISSRSRVRTSTGALKVVGEIGPTGAGVSYRAFAASGIPSATAATTSAPLSFDTLASLGCTAGLGGQDGSDDGSNDGSDATDEQRLSGDEGQGGSGTGSLHVSLHRRATKSTVTSTTAKTTTIRTISALRAHPSMPFSNVPVARNSPNQPCSRSVNTAAPATAARDLPVTPAPTRRSSSKGVQESEKRRHRSREADLLKPYLNSPVKGRSGGRRRRTTAATTTTFSSSSSSEVGRRTARSVTDAASTSTPVEDKEEEGDTLDAPAREIKKRRSEAHLLANYLPSPEKKNDRERSGVQSLSNLSGNRRRMPTAATVVDTDASNPAMAPPKRRRTALSFSPVTPAISSSLSSSSSSSASSSSSYSTPASRTPAIAPVTAEARKGGPQGQGLSKVVEVFLEGNPATTLRKFPTGNRAAAELGLVQRYISGRCLEHRETGRINPLLGLCWRFSPCNTMENHNKTREMSVENLRKIVAEARQLHATSSVSGSGCMDSGAASSGDISGKRSRKRSREADLLQPYLSSPSRASGQGKGRR